MTFQGTAFLRSLVGRLIFFTFCWWAITEGDLAALPAGIPAIGIALVLSMHLIPAKVMRIRGLLQFLPLFLWRSMAGATDVARRAFTPRLPLQPALVDYRTSLRNEDSRVFFANLLSLLPGTLSVDVSGHVLCLHVLFPSAANEKELGRLERAVARVFP